MKKKKPILAFIRDKNAIYVADFEDDPSRQELLKKFKERVTKNQGRELWTSSDYHCKKCSQ
ncbi:hypothetical protein FACS1894190_16280 [Spirochaetia bacterium]|nr:hypothetical protein FACS1894190_16280 [Spirochaetia bacterium]